MRENDQPADTFYSEDKGCSLIGANESNHESRDDQIVISNFNGCLLQSTSSFPYFFLLAFETGWILRSAALLLVSPFTSILSLISLDAIAIRILIYVAFAGVKMRQIEMLSRSVLPKFFSDDVHSPNLKLFLSYGKRHVVTEMPRVMVEPFATEHVGVNRVIGTELAVSSNGRATGLVKRPGVLVGENKRSALKLAFEDESISPNYIDSLHGVRGIAANPRDHKAFLSMFKEVYIVSPKLPKTTSHEREAFLKRPIIFNDGRLVERPTPLVALFTLLWIPFGFLLALIRIWVCQVVPMSHLYYALALLGVKVIVKGTPPISATPVASSLQGQQDTINNTTAKNKGVIYVCNHRTLMDPVFLAIALRRRITAVTFSLSRLSEIISPIYTVRLTRSKEEDAATMNKILNEDARDLVVCPEGTTCRFPYLLRFSALFAEVGDQIIPVAMMNGTSVFHATSSGKWKSMDPFYFFMNPLPWYEVKFLEQLPPEQTCSGGNKTRHEVANNVQRLLAAHLKFQCTNMTRKDKYLALVGNDGSFSAHANKNSNKVAKTS